MSMFETGVETFIKQASLTETEAQAIRDGIANYDPEQFAKDIRTFLEQQTVKQASEIRDQFDKFATDRNVGADIVEKLWQAVCDEFEKTAVIDPGVLGVGVGALGGAGLGAVMAPKGKRLAGAGIGAGLGGAAGFMVQQPINSAVSALNTGVTGGDFRGFGRHLIDQESYPYIPQLPNNHVSIHSDQPDLTVGETEQVRQALKNGQDTNIQ